MKRKQIIFAAVINGIIFLTVAAAILSQLLAGEGGQSAKAVERTLKYFTNLSNIYCAFISLAAMIYEIGMLKSGKTQVPHALLIWKQTGTAAVALTFFTVLFFLAPVSGQYWYTFYVDEVFFLHFLDPLLAMLCFIFLEKGEPLSLKEDLFALIPVIAYEALYLTQVVILKHWKDFYGFTFGGKFWAPFIVVPIMAGVTFLLSFLLSFLQKKVSAGKKAPEALK